MINSNLLINLLITSFVSDRFDLFFKILEDDLSAESSEFEGTKALEVYQILNTYKEGLVRCDYPYLVSELKDLNLNATEILKLSDFFLLHFLLAVKIRIGFYSINGCFLNRSIGNVFESILVDRKIDSSDIQNILEALNKILKENSFELSYFEQASFSSLSLFANRIDLYKFYRFYLNIKLDSNRLFARDYDCKFEVKNFTFLSLFKSLFGSANNYSRVKQYYDDGVADLIRNKSVAIVGPVDVCLDNGGEIDSFDVVIRFNYKGLNGCDSNKFGTKTNISYYITADMKLIECNAALIEQVNNLDYTLHCGGSHIIYKNNRFFTAKHARRLPVQKMKFNPLYMGSANAIQKVILDVLRYSPLKIKVFNANLWVSNNVVENYRSKKAFKVSKMMYHDSVSNFIFTKKLFVRGLIEADNVLKDVLNLTPEEYVEKLDA